MSSGIGSIEFAENPEPRCPCVLLLDTSGSMQGDPIDALNEGLRRFRDEVNQDRLASRRVEVAIVCFDSDVSVEQDFITADQFDPPELTVGGLTRMGKGIRTALDLIDARKVQYKANGIAYYRPWIFLITDGEPQGEVPGVMEDVSRRIVEDELHKRVAFFAVGVRNANMKMLGDISVRPPLKLAGLSFVELFVWLSATMQAVSQSKLDEQVALPAPDWTEV